MKNNNIPLLYDCRAKVLLVVLFFLCNIVALTKFGKNPKFYFFNNKESSTSLATTKVSLQVSDFVSRTDGSTPLTIYFLMLTENPIVTASEHANVTPIQQILVNNHFNLKKPFSFFECYLCVLPYFNTREDAFGYVNNVAFKRHKSFSFINYKSLINEIYA